MVFLKEELNLSHSTWCLKTTQQTMLSQNIFISIINGLVKNRLRTLTVFANQFYAIMLINQTPTFTIAATTGKINVKWNLATPEPNMYILNHTLKDVKTFD